MVVVLVSGVGVTHASIEVESEWKSRESHSVDCNTNELVLANLDGFWYRYSISAFVTEMCPPVDGTSDNPRWKSRRARRQQR